MKLNEIFQNSACPIYKVINFYDAEKMEDWIVEETDYQLIPESNDELYDAYFVVKGFLIEGSHIEKCFIDVCIPERISEFVFRNKNGNLIIENIVENNLQTIPSVASEQYGDPELYYLKENPKLGIEILKAGKKISANPSAIKEDLADIWEELGKFRKMKIKNIDEAVNVFLNSAIENVKLFDGRDHKLANKYYKQMKQSFDFLTENNCINKLLPLLDYPNYGVQLWTASFLAKEYKDKVIVILQKIIDLKILHISFSAEYTLKGILEN